MELARLAQAGNLFNYYSIEYQNFFLTTHEGNMSKLFKIHVKIVQKSQILTDKFKTHRANNQTK